MFKMKKDFKNKKTKEQSWADLGPRPRGRCLAQPGFGPQHPGHDAVTAPRGGAVAWLLPAWWRPELRAVCTSTITVTPATSRARRRGQRCSAGWLGPRHERGGKKGDWGMVAAHLKGHDGGGEGKGGVLAQARPRGGGVGGPGRWL
jgi:hypothetical protein